MIYLCIPFPDCIPLSYPSGGEGEGPDSPGLKTLKGPHKMINCCQIGFFASHMAKQTIFPCRIWLLSIFKAKE